MCSAFCEHVCSYVLVHRSRRYPRHHQHINNSFCMPAMRIRRMAKPQLSNKMCFCCVESGTKLISMEINRNRATPQSHSNTIHAIAIWFVTHYPSVSCTYEMERIPLHGRRRLTKIWFHGSQSEHAHTFDAEVLHVACTMQFTICTTHVN